MKKTYMPDMDFEHMADVMKAYGETDRGRGEQGGGSEGSRGDGGRGRGH